MKATLIYSLLLVLAVGCAKDEPLPQHQSSAATPASNTTTQVNTSTTATTPPTSAPATAAAAGSPIATTDGEQSGVTLNVTELKRGSGETLMLKFTIMNGSSEEVSFGYDFTDRSISEYGTVGGVHLIDPVGKKKYFVVRDSESKCVCSKDVKSIKPGESRTLWAKFPAPPPDVQRVSVIVPHFTPMDDVPIS